MREHYSESTPAQDAGRIIVRTLFQNIINALNIRALCFNQIFSGVLVVL